MNRRSRIDDIHTVIRIIKSEHDLNRNWLIMKSFIYPSNVLYIKCDLLTLSDTDTIKL